MIAGETFTILMADDDEDDRELACTAVSEACVAGRRLRFVEDGEALLDYLHRRGRYADPAESPRPDVILLDLSMPRMNGAEALRAIKSDPGLRAIPIVVFTTSREEHDVVDSYQAGAASYLQKPATYAALLDVVRDLDRYWFDTVELPPRQEV